jgi:hypothetical protein
MKQKMSVDLSHLPCHLLHDIVNFLLIFYLLRCQNKENLFDQKANPLKKYISEAAMSIQHLLDYPYFCISSVNAYTSKAKYLL